MEKQQINFEDKVIQLSEEEIKLIKGCILTAQETLKCIPFKNKDIKNKIEQIKKLQLKF